LDDLLPTPQFRFSNAPIPLLMKQRNGADDARRACGRNRRSKAIEGVSLRRRTQGYAHEAGDGD
jgi:hypothetical protein